MEQTSISNLNTKSTVDDNDYLVVDDLSSTNKILAKTILDVCKSELLAKLYPVGSIYMSVNSTSPATLFGGTWDQIKDTFLLGSGSYSLGATGGSKAHTHTYGLKVGGYYNETLLAESDNAGLLSFSDDSNYSLSGWSSDGFYTVSVNSSTTSVVASKSVAHYKYMANTSYTNTLPPYLVVNIWKRTA